MTRSLAGALALWLICSTAQAQEPAQEPQLDDRRTGLDEEARVLFNAGEIAYHDGRFRDAYERFREAYELSGRPQLLFNMGLAAERARLDREALDHYRAYLRDVPDAPNRSGVANRIVELEGLVATQSASSADDADAAAAPVADEGPAAPATHTQMSPVGPIVLAAGGVVLVTGLIVGAVSLGQASAFQDMCTDLAACPATLQPQYDEMRAFSAAADGLVIAGAGTAILGLVLMLTLQEEVESDVTASASCGPNGCQAVMGGRF